MPKACWLAGCGDADLRVNRRHEHLDLHMFQGTPAGHPTKQPASQHVPPCRMGRKSVRIGTFSYQNRYHLGQRSFPDFAPQNSKGWPGTSGSTDSETRVNRGARALCLHVNQRPRSQTASQHSARLGTLETRVNRSARALCLHVNRCSHHQMQARTIGQFSERRGTTCPPGQLSQNKARTIGQFSER